RHNHLFGIKPELAGDVFDCVDGGAIKRGLAGFAQSPEACLDPEATEQAAERGGTAIDGRGLDDLGSQDGAAKQRSHFALPFCAPSEASAWNMRTPGGTMDSTGETRPTSI